MAIGDGIFHTGSKREPKKERKLEGTLFLVKVHHITSHSKIKMARKSKFER
jgi:hypothetical protein